MEVRNLLDSGHTQRTNGNLALAIKDWSSAARNLQDQAGENMLNNQKCDNIDDEFQSLSFIVHKNLAFAWLLKNSSSHVDIHRNSALRALIDAGILDDSYNIQVIIDDQFSSLIYYLIHMVTETTEESYDMLITDEAESILTQVRLFLCHE